MDYLNYGKQVQQRPQPQQKPQQKLQSKVELTMDDFNFGNLSAPENKNEVVKVQSPLGNSVETVIPPSPPKSQPKRPAVRKDEIVSLFPTPLLISSYPNDFGKELEWMKSRECKDAYQNNDRDFPGSLNKQSKDSFILDNPEMVNIRKFIEIKLSSYVIDILGSSDQLLITQSWLNFNGHNQALHEHIHPNSIVSGVWYPQIDTKMPPIKFSKNQQSQWQLSTEKYNSFNGMVCMFPMNKGELIIFPSWIRHSVPINTKNSDRISLSFNTWAKGSLGTKDDLTYLPLDRCV